MYLMYADESGDTGLPPPKGKSPTRLFCLSGLVVHELRWSDTLRELVRFRHWIKRRYGIYLDEELHAAVLLTRPSKLPPSLSRLSKHERLAIIRHHADLLASLSDIRLINVCVDKSRSRIVSPDDVFRRAWYALFQRFENTIRRRNFPEPRHEHERGIIFPDLTDSHRLRKYLDQMRVRNILRTQRRPGYFEETDEPIRLVIEDPICRDSRHSYFIQAVDCAVFLFKQHLEPSKYIKKHGAHAYFRKRLYPVLCFHASQRDHQELGIVRL